MITDKTKCIRMMAEPWHMLLLEGRRTQAGEPAQADTPIKDGPAGSILWCCQGGFGGRRGFDVLGLVVTEREQVGSPEGVQVVGRAIRMGWAPAPA